MSLFYQDPSTSHDEATKLLASGVDADVIAGLISIGLNEGDRIWAQNTCLKYLANGTESVAAAAVTTLGHIARRHNKLDREMVLPALERVQQQFPALEGVVADTLDDLDAFT
ncbi:hypothetical protein ACQKQA_10770 [Pseudomonas sp. NPDC089530]|uniref:hypothetical protein n=1 Tax=Pseudomonas sp. NPDC089530 TaxID=3390651 RepID=UPI003D07D5A0